MSDVAGARLSTASSVTRLLITHATVARTHRGLRDRSAGVREAACVWVGTRAGAEACITDVIFHHELADDRATPLSLQLPEYAKFALYRRLAVDGHSVLALLHTHPAAWVGLSLVDQQNQIGSRIGFWSIVLPFYGGSLWSIDEIGFHVRCARGWRQLTASEVAHNLVIEP